MTDKAGVHSRAGVPVYLLLDMQEERSTVFRSPSPHGYQGRVTKSFGEKSYIPEPFGCTLDADGFQPPQTQA
ncbi:Uma2 family endonuclease [Streptomyces sp. NPDC056160]|uniref:Uma2 family endonuclease n=1 Tax=Streptomyces sp. NPDC056160 TaxID=3345731 RepID=UPI0035D79572